MDRFDEQMLNSLAHLYDLREQLAAETVAGVSRVSARGMAGRVVDATRASSATSATSADEDDKPDGTDDNEDVLVPVVPAMPLTPPEHLNRRRAVARVGDHLEAQTWA